MATGHFRPVASRQTSNKTSPPYHDPPCKHSPPVRFRCPNAIDHRRKYTNDPYTTHLERAANLVATVTDDAAMIAAAYLHDAVEDTNTTIEDIIERFGDDVGYLVTYLTDVSKPEDGDRAVRKRIDRDHIAQGDARVTPSSWRI